MFSEQVTSSHSPHASSLEHFNWIQCFVSLQILHFANLDTLRHPAWLARDCDIRFRGNRVTFAAPATEKGHEDLTKRTASGLQRPKKNGPHFWVSSSLVLESTCPEIHQGMFNPKPRDRVQHTHHLPFALYFGEVVRRPALLYAYMEMRRPGVDGCGSRVWPPNP